MIVRHKFCSVKPIALHQLGHDKIQQVVEAFGLIEVNRKILLLPNQDLVFLDEFKRVQPFELLGINVVQVLDSHSNMSYLLGEDGSTVFVVENQQSPKTDGVA